jgi:hypothetical protein
MSATYQLQCFSTKAGITLNAGAGLAERNAHIFDLFRFSPNPKLKSKIFIYHIVMDFLYPRQVIVLTARIVHK